MNLLLIGALALNPVVLDEAVVENPTPSVEEKTYTWEEIQGIINEKVEEIKKWSEETQIFGYSIAGIVAAAPSVCLGIYSAVKRRKESKLVKEGKEIILAEWNTLKQNTTKEIDDIKTEFLEYKERTFQVFDNFKAETDKTLAVLKENNESIKETLISLEQYEKFNDVVNTTASMLREMANTPEFVKYGVAEKVNRLYEEVK